jgi:hypothetical protein
MLNNSGSTGCVSVIQSFAYFWLGAVAIVAAGVMTAVLEICPDH